jgi:hypothetical protein
MRHLKKIEVYQSNSCDNGWPESDKTCKKCWRPFAASSQTLPGGDVIPDQLLHFIRGSIKSVWTLDLLILMRRARERSWTLDALTHELRGNRTLVHDVLSALVTAGLVQVDAEGSYRYRPATPELDSLVEQLERVYVERPLALIKEIVSAPNEKIQSFADAFKIKKE